MDVSIIEISVCSVLIDIFMISLTSVVIFYSFLIKCIFLLLFLLDFVFQPFILHFPSFHNFISLFFRKKFQIKLILFYWRKLHLFINSVIIPYFLRRECSYGQETWLSYFNFLSRNFILGIPVIHVVLVGLRWIILWWFHLLFKYLIYKLIGYKLNRLPDKTGQQKYSPDLQLCILNFRPS